MPVTPPSSNRPALRPRPSHYDSFTLAGSLLNERVHADDVHSAVGHRARIARGHAIHVDRHHGRQTAGGREHALERDASLRGVATVVSHEQRVSGPECPAVGAAILYGWA